MFTGRGRANKTNETAAESMRRSAAGPSNSKKRNTKHSEPQTKPQKVPKRSNFEDHTESLKEQNGTAAARAKPVCGHGSTKGQRSKLKTQPANSSNRNALSEIVNQQLPSPSLLVPQDFRRPRQPRQPRQYSRLGTVDKPGQCISQPALASTSTAKGEKRKSKAIRKTVTNHAPVQEEKQKSRKRARRLVDVEVDLLVPDACTVDPKTSVTEYERQRAERIRQNQDRLKELGIQDAVVELQRHIQTMPAKLATGLAARAPKKRELVSQPLPARKSSRLQLGRPRMVESRGGAAGETQNVVNHSTAATELATDGPEGAWMSQEEYFKLINKDVSTAIVSDGHFNGWVKAEVCTAFGIECSADEAWEKNGGGQYTHKIDKKAIPTSLKAKGWSDARAFSATMLKKNPNAYFYRHVAPGEKQAQGDWTDEEHKLFVDTARKYGVGDKWGLFASYIPQRVGYQCSAYYREVVIPSGIVLDKRFQLSRSGRAVFVG